MIIPRALTSLLASLLLIAAVPAAGPDGGGATAATAAPPAKTRPNIVFILLDDAREEGVMNVPAVLPRTKRWLVAGGTTFTEGYATSSLCCPERATIWSGRLPHNHGVFDNHGGDNLDRDWIIPRYLGDAGYRTALVGKFITDWQFRYDPPHLDDYAVFQGGYVDHTFMVKDPGQTRHRNEKAAFTTDYIADKAVQFIEAYEATDDQPWFMQVAPHPPHNIVEAAKHRCDMRDLYWWPQRHEQTPVPPWKPTPAVTEEGTNREAKSDKVPYVQRYDFPADCAGVTYEGHMKTLLAADEMVDRIMTTLQATGELDNTLVILTSDNGFSWGERGLTSKGLPYTEHVKVPFLVRWDGVFPAGARDPRPVGGEDFLPTYLAAAGYTPPELRYPLDGRSFLPGAPGREVKYLEFGPVGRPTPRGYDGHRSIPSWASLRTTHWQYLEYYEDDNTTVHFAEFYDLRSDPWELENLLADADPGNDPDVAALSRRLQGLWDCAGTSGAGACP